MYYYLFLFFFFGKEAKVASTPNHDRKTLVQCISSFDLKSFDERASIICCGKLFQEFTTRWEKSYFIANEKNGTCKFLNDVLW